MIDDIHIVNHEPRLGRVIHIVVRVDNTGIAPRDSLYTAVDDDRYDGPGSPIGTGPTVRAAIDDLLDQLER
jgi:hypothetical protein